VIDVLIPTRDRPAALAVLLAGLAAQTRQDLRVVVADQSGPGCDPFAAGEVRAAAGVLALHGVAVEVHRRPERRGMAEQRQFLLDRATAPYALFLDDDLVLEPDLVERLAATLAEEGCGFVGSALIGPSFAADERPHELEPFAVWDGPVAPERIEPLGPGWERWTLHNAANPLHLARRLGLTGADRVRYRVAWVGGCVLYDTAALREAGGFGFWRDLPPEHAGEDVVAQLRVMALRGGCGILPSGAYHQELPTTVTDRRVDAWRDLEVHPAAGVGA
jgi:glycosyltransferase involved in cell wall biosynthesis